MMSTYDAFILASKLAIEVHADEQAEKLSSLLGFVLGLDSSRVHDGKKEALNEPISNWLLQ